MKYKAFVLVGGLVSLLVFGIVSLGLFRGIEYSLSDRLYTGKQVDPRIVIVGIDAETLDELGQWPLPRAVFAQGLQRIIDEAPQSIGIDILFANPSRLGNEDDNALKEVLENSPIPITLPVEGFDVQIKATQIPTAGNVLYTHPQFTGKNISYGHINLIQDRDGIVRRIPRTILDGETKIQSFSGQVMSSIHDDTIARIVFSGTPGTIRHISFKDVVLGTFDSSLIKNAFVFIGATATDLHDEQTTPVSAGTAMAGVEIQAQIGNMFISNYSLTDIAFPIFILWLSLLILIPLVLFFFARNILIPIIASASLFLVNITAITYLFASGIIVDIVYTSLALIISALTSFSVRYFILERERREIHGVFSKYVSKAVLEKLLENPRAVKLGGESAEVTIFFSDIRGFTSLSEKLTPTELTQLLNRYLTSMTDIILQNDGVVDKYIGDAIMAFWGAPLRNPLHAIHAVQSALIMLTTLDIFNEESLARGEQIINIGIGLNTGDVIVGNMGSTQRFDYTIMGDAVNLGARLEGQTKTYGVRLLVSESTVAAVQRTLGTEHTLLIRELDKVTVKGKKTAVAIFEVVEEKKKEFVTSILSDFETLRTAYYNGDWNTAVNVGNAILSHGEDGPTKILLLRAQELSKNPPETWTGVYELTTK